MFLQQKFSQHRKLLILWWLHKHQCCISADWTWKRKKVENCAESHVYLGFFRGKCNDTFSDWRLLHFYLGPVTKGPLRVNASPAASGEFWKVSTAFLICSLTALIINWGAIVPGQLSTVYSALSLGLAELTQSCPFNFTNWQLLFTFMSKESTVPESGYICRNVTDALLYVAVYVCRCESSFQVSLGDSCIQKSGY